MVCNKQGTILDSEDSKMARIVSLNSANLPSNKYDEDCYSTLFLCSCLA